LGTELACRVPGVTRGGHWDPPQIWRSVAFTPRATISGESTQIDIYYILRQYLFADNGAEFTRHLVDLWAYHHGIRIDFSRPGKPTDNAHIETFNGSLRDECLNLHWFETIADARRIIERWRRDYNPASQHPSVYVIEGKRVC
jgi:hypothetical protein